VLAACLVRKPGAATIAMTINGLMQFYIDGFIGPHHLVYGLTGLGADVGFAIFRYRRFDALASMLAGIMCQLFWIPITYTYHAVFGRFPLAWFPGDLVARMVGGALGDGLLGFAIAFVVLIIGRSVSGRTGLGRGKVGANVSAFQTRFLPNWLR
jgi:energy-coupling factor transport system substrate-specific component